jgi:predicted transcriptional regulator YdeE
MTDRDQGFRLEVHERCWLTGLAITGPFELAESRTDAAWQSLAERTASSELLQGQEEWLSACHIRETELTCYVGMASDNAPSDPVDDLVTIQIPRHEYLVARHSGNRADLGNLYAAMFAWLQRHDREVNREILWLERYSAPLVGGAALDMEIWLPLREQGGLD